MHPSIHARTTPDKAAVIMDRTGATLTYAQLDRASNQAARLLRGLGLHAGDCIALLMDNSAAFFEIAWAAQRSGLYFTCISTRLTTDEVAYILNDSGARVLFVSQAHATVGQAACDQAPAVLACFCTDASVAGFDDYARARDGQPDTPLENATAGTDMLYSSGTTGRPKGVKLALSGAPVDAPNPLAALAQMVYGISADSRYLSPAPLYHAAPLRWCMGVHRIGGTVVVMEKFDPESYLAAVGAHRITDTQLVPTMFVKMLKLPEEVRAAFDLSSLKMAVHAAAPCPIPVKQQMIDWWGPIIHEYYAGTEGNGFCTLDATQWLAHKGSVGKAILGEVRIVGENGNEVPVGAEGTVYFANGPRFEYHNDPQKTADSRNAQGWTTLGDIGRLDEEGYLYLTDRKAFMIISGGVNIYPQETENALITHPKVADVAVFGVPDEEFGEAVKAVVQPLDMAEAGEDLAAELMAWCRAQISPFKCPKTIDFMQDLPRQPTGKLYKRLLRDRYWQEEAS